MIPPTANCSPDCPPPPPHRDRIEIEGETFLRMPEVDRLEPFLMTVVGDSDCWLFAGSNGGFTAGRVDADHALFPYRTADKILRQPAAAGAVCILQTGDHTWEPWANPASAGATVNATKISRIW